MTKLQRGIVAACAGALLGVAGIWTVNACVMFAQHVGPSSSDTVVVVGALLGLPTGLLLGRGRLSWWQAAGLGWAIALPAHALLFGSLLFVYGWDEWSGNLPTYLLGTAVLPLGNLLGAAFFPAVWAWLLPQLGEPVPARPARTVSRVTMTHHR